MKFKKYAPLLLLFVVAYSLKANEGAILPIEKEGFTTYPGYEKYPDDFIEEQEVIDDEDIILPIGRYDANGNLIDEKGNIIVDEQQGQFLPIEENQEFDILPYVPGKNRGKRAWRSDRNLNRNKGWRKKSNRFGDNNDGFYDEFSEAPTGGSGEGQILPIDNNSSEKYFIID